jgi:flagellar basal-body rod modification protein FlgD
MTTNPITGSAAPQTPTISQPTNVADALTSTDTFLQLLVAQLKNQDPLQPADSTAFVTQLATFSGVEQSTEMRDDLDAIKTTLANTAAAAATAAAAVPVAPASTTTSSSNASTTTN